MPTSRGLGLLDVVHGNWRSIHARIVELSPIGGDAELALFFEFALGLDAECGVWQGLQACQGYGFAARFANAVGTVVHPRQGFFDLGQLVTFQFGKLRIDFVMRCIQGDVDFVSATLSFISLIRLESPASAFRKASRRNISVFRSF